MKKVLIGIATRGCDMYYKLAGWLLNQQHKEGLQLEVLFAQSNSSASYSQNLLFKAVAEGDWDYLLMLDSDICPPDDAIERMLEADKDMVKAPVWHFSPHTREIHVDITKANDTVVRRVCDTPAKGLEKIVTTSFSCLLIKKEVLKGYMDKGEDFTTWSSILPEAFKDIQSDTIFFAKARVLGYEIWVDWSITDTIHYKYVELSNHSLDKYFVNRIKESEEMVR